MKKYTKKGRIIKERTIKERTIVIPEKLWRDLDISEMSATSKHITKQKIIGCLRRCCVVY